MAYNSNQFQSPLQQFQFWNFQDAGKTPVATESDNGTIEKKLPSLRHRIKENSRLLPQSAIDIMTAWYDQHYTNPYPNFKDCEELAEAGKVSVNQVKQWFVNVRRRTHNEFRRRRANKTTKSKKSNDKLCEEILKDLPLSSDDSGYSNNDNDGSPIAPKPYQSNNYPATQINYNYNYLNYQYCNNANSYMYANNNNQQYSTPKIQQSYYNYSASTPSTSISSGNYSFNSSYGDLERNNTNYNNLYYSSMNQQSTNETNYANYNINNCYN